MIELFYENFLKIGNDIMNSRQEENEVYEDYIDRLTMEPCIEGLTEEENEVVYSKSRY